MTEMVFTSSFAAPSTSLDFTRALSFLIWVLSVPFRVLLISRRRWFFRTFLMALLVLANVLSPRLVKV